MSATGRNLEGRERHANDFYETPEWCTRAILPHLAVPRTVIDAGAGTGAIARVCREVWPMAAVLEVEKERGGDFSLAVAHVDLVISNPPYSIAERFVEHALTLGREVCFLLRLNWLASKKRAAFHRAHPADVFVLPKRPSFTGGGTDATEYAWFVWNRTSRGNRWFLLDVDAPSRTKRKPSAESRTLPLFPENADAAKET